MAIRFDRPFLLFMYRPEHLNSDKDRLDILDLWLGLVQTISKRIVVDSTESIKQLSYIH
jgi:hypothetical protein